MSGSVFCAYDDCRGSVPAVVMMVVPLNPRMLAVSVCLAHASAMVDPVPRGVVV